MKLEEGTVYYRYDFTWEETQAHMQARKLQNSGTTESGEQLGLGMIMIAKDSSAKSNHYRLGECTAFLLDETTLVTNSHCVPKRVREKEVSCENRIVFAHSGSYRNYNCKSVKFSHASYNLNDDTSVRFNGTYVPDVTILEIEPVYGVAKYFKQSEEALKVRSSNEELFMSSVDPVQNTKTMFEGKYSLRKRFRNADSEGSGFPFRYFLAEAGVFFIQGNSGSPIHDRDYNVKAIAFAGSSGDTDATVVDLFCLEENLGQWRWKPNCVSTGRITK